MSKNIIAFLGALVLLATSCTSVHKTASTAAVDAYVLQYPTVADLEVSPQKVTKTVTWVGLFNMTPLERRKSNLNAELLAESDADVLIEPQYIYHKNLIDQCKLTVTGFPAKYKNFRKATDADLEAIRCGAPGIYKVSDGTPRHHKKDVKKKKKFLFF